MKTDDFEFAVIGPEAFEVVKEWFVGHGWEVAPSLSALPETGWACLYRGKPQACGWLYLTNSSVGILEWTATNPNEPAIERVRSLKMLIQFIKKQARLMGVKSIIQFVVPENLVRYYQKHLGFIGPERATLVTYNIKGDE